jgi:hypothetical protein
MAHDGKLSGHLGDHSLSGCHRIAGVLDAGQHNRKFAAANSRHNTLFAHAPLDPFRGFPQKTVAKRASEGVVHDFEAGKFKQQQRGALLSSPQNSEHLRELQVEERSIR